MELIVYDDHAEEFKILPLDIPKCTTKNYSSELSFESSIASPSIYEYLQKQVTLSITNYTYDSIKGVTIIEWIDGTKTVVRAENPDAADKFTGFMTAVAKKAMGNDNTVNKLFDEWAIKRPLKKLEHQKKQQKEKAEVERISKKRAEKKRKWLVRKRAAEIAREYESQKIAEEKYGVPMGLRFPCALDNTSEFDEVLTREDK